jgi:hypothetical protein
MGEPAFPPDLAPPWPRRATQGMGGAEPPGATRRRLGARAWRGWRAPDLPRSEHCGTLYQLANPAYERMSCLPLRHGLQWGLLGFTARRNNAEYQLMRAFPSPDFDTALQRSQQFIRISVWLLRLKPFQQFS